MSEKAGRLDPMLLHAQCTQADRNHVTTRRMISFERLPPQRHLRGVSTGALLDWAFEAGRLASLPAGAAASVTAELQTGFAGPVSERVMRREAPMEHASRTAQGGNAHLQSEANGLSVARLGCTPMLLRPKARDISSSFGPSTLTDKEDS